MKEFKLIPLSEVDISEDKIHSKPTHAKSMGDVLEVGNEDFNVVMKNLLTDKKTDEHFKLKLMNYISQKMDNKINKIFQKHQKMRINLSLTRIYSTLLKALYLQLIYPTHSDYLHILLKKMMFNGISMGL